MIPKWDEYFMDMVDLAATRSPCLRRQVGAIIVRDHRVLTTGYNGPPSGIEHCTSETCIRIVQNIPSGERLDLCVAVHAEQNAIIQAAHMGISLQGSTMYTSGLPCIQCTKMILNSGISDIVFANIKYDDVLAKKMWKEQKKIDMWLFISKSGGTCPFNKNIL